MTEPAAFFELHRDLPREGPGSAEDVAYAAALAELPEGAVIADAGAGPGGDIAALLAAGRDARVVALDLHRSFVDQAAARFADDPRVKVRHGDMATLAGLEDAPFDLIWCAGALYFLGLEAGLASFRRALKPSGVVAFSEPCFFVDAPSSAARDFWQGHATRSGADILRKVRAAGYDILGHRPIADAGWEAYYQLLDARMQALRGDADTALAAILDQSRDEAALWRKVRDETGYLLVVARKQAEPSGLDA